MTRPARSRDGGDLPVETELRERYLDHLASTLPSGTPLEGLKVVLDAGNGAASSYAGEIFERLGARVTLLHAEPNGRNVNEGCGSTAPDEMAARVAAEGADLGAAFDGDADRCILADDQGQVRDGDAILYLWATHLHEQGQLDPLPDRGDHDEQPGPRAGAGPEGHRRSPAAPWVTATSWRL